MLGNKRGNLLRDYVADYTVFDLETTEFARTMMPSLKFRR